MGRKKAAKFPSASWGNRIVATGTVQAGQLLGNEKNWRVHPIGQQTALGDVLTAVGFVQTVVVNKRTDKAWGKDRNVETLVDGHLRVQLALSRGEGTEVPVTYVDLTPAEENLVLVTLDPIAALAGKDAEKLTALLLETEVAWGADVDLKAILKMESSDDVENQLVSDTFLVVITCADESEQVQLLERFVAEGLTCRALVS